MSVKVALYVNDYLPYSQVWISRQNAPECNIKTVLCHRRSNENNFPLDRFVEQIEINTVWQYVKARFWFVFKYIPYFLSSKSKNKFKHELIAQRIEVVHAHFGTNGVLISPLCKELKLPLVVTFHGFDISAVPMRWPQYDKKLKSLFQQISYAIAISQEMANCLLLMGCPKEKVRVSFLGVPVSESSYFDRSYRSESLKFLHVGRLTSKKGVRDLIEVFIDAFGNDDYIELHIVGDGEEERVLKDLAAQSKNHNKIIFHGQLSYDKVEELMRNCDVFVLNSRTDEMGTKEGLPISILEACSVGLPVISTYHAGIPESIIHEETGILIQEKDNVALKGAMLRMKSMEFRIKMGKAGHRYMMDKFDLNKCNENLVDIYASARM